MQIHQTDFSTGNVYRNIMEVAVPMIIAQILNLLYNIVDRIYIGRIPEIGATALTGVGLCFPIITLITAFTYLFGNGGAPLCSMERGRGNREEAEMLMGNTFVMLLGTGVILTAIGLIFYRPILYAFGASDVTFSYASDYIRIYLLGTLFVMITLGMNPFINSQGFGNTGDAHDTDRCCTEHSSGSPVYLWDAHGSPGSGFGDYHFPVLFRHLGLTLPYRKKGDPEPEKKAP